MANFSKDVQNYDEGDDSKQLTDIATKAESVAEDETDDERLKTTYIIAGSAAGAVAVVGAVAITLGVLSSQGKLAPSGFAPVETAV